VFGRIEQELEWLRNKKASCIKYLDMATVYLISVPELIKCKCFALADKFNSYIKDVLSPPLKEPPQPVPIHVPVNKSSVITQNQIIFA
jgi:hypothetical protein